MLFEKGGVPTDLSSSLEAWTQHGMEPDRLQFLTHQEAEVGLDELASAVTLEQYLVGEKVSVFLLERPEYASP